MLTLSTITETSPTEKTWSSSLALSKAKAYCKPEQPPPLSAGTVFAYGHTHLPHLERQMRMVAFNPGSISLPKGGNPPSFGFYDHGRLSILNLLSGDSMADMTLE